MPRINYRDIPDGAPSPGGFKAWLAERPQMPYVLPFFAFVLLMLPAAFPPEPKLGRVTTLLLPPLTETPGRAGVPLVPVPAPPDPG